ncbi:hypothetical protein GS934_18320 [Rhodococcus hoagii]|nr:hypothetical protein [Prescottella equi]NKZ88276.1 hypothetical protein [Prescottella equi]
MLHRAEPDSADYVMPIVVRFGESLDPRALAAAVRDVVDRHEALRTYYPDETRQAVASSGDVEVAIVHEPLSRNELDRWIGRMASRPFDLTSRPPLRAALLRAESAEWILVVVTHHIAVDGASVAPLLGDGARAYAARAGGVAPQWESLPLRYRDFAHWQVRLLGDLDDPDSVGGRQLAYWARALTGAPDGPLALPFDRPRPAVPTHVGGTVHAVVGPELHAALVDSARRQGVTVFMILHAALAALLARYGGRDDVTIGTVVSGRPDARLDSVVGMFVSTLALRTVVDRAESFGEFLRRVRDVDLGALAHSRRPVRRRRRAGRSPPKPRAPSAVPGSAGALGSRTRTARPTGPRPRRRRTGCAARAVRPGVGHDRARRRARRRRPRRVRHRSVRRRHRRRSRSGLGRAARAGRGRYVDGGRRPGVAGAPAAHRGHGAAGAGSGRDSRRDRAAVPGPGGAPLWRRKLDLHRTGFRSRGSLAGTEGSRSAGRRHRARRRGPRSALGGRGVGAEPAGGGLGADRSVAPRATSPQSARRRRERVG